MSYTPREYKDAPPKLVENGQIAFGTYNAPVKEVNLLDAANPFELPLPVPAPILNLRLKEWQAFQLGTERYFCLIALYNAKTIALAQLIVYDKQSGQKLRYEKKLPIWAIQVPGSLLHSDCTYRDGHFDFRVENRLDNGTINVAISIKNFENLPDIELKAEGLHDRGRPQVVSLPFAKNRGMYSHKNLFPCRGSLVVGQENNDLSENDAFMIVDHHKGFYPYVMEYDWVTAAGFFDGRLVGLNLTRNQALEPEKYNENCLWMDDTIELLPAVQFDRPRGVEGPWHIFDRYGMVELTFTPEMQSDLKLNLIFIESDYHGPYGKLTGRVKTSEGDFNFDGSFGMGEKFYLRS